NSAGNGLSYSTYLGGGGDERGVSLALDGSANAFITGFTDSDDFPTTSGAFQTSRQGSQDAFVTELKSDGSGVVFSTYLGGTDDDDTGRDITLNGAGNAFVTGDTKSDDFP